MSRPFTYFNPNPDARIDKKTGKPKRWSKGDCVIRAFCGVLNLPWTMVFHEMCIIAEKQFDMPNSHRVIDLYAKQKNLIKVSLPDYIKVSTFAETHDGVYLVNIRSHVACIKNNMVNDCWDCGNYKMKTYYTIKK